MGSWQVLRDILNIAPLFLKISYLKEHPKISKCGNFEDNPVNKDEVIDYQSYVFLQRMYGVGQTCHAIPAKSPLRSKVIPFDSL